MGDGAAAFGGSTFGFDGLFAIIVKTKKLTKEVYLWNVLCMPVVFVVNISELLLL